MTQNEQETPDFRIDQNGQWFHEGALIKREALAKLFSDRALKIDKDGNYWLQTPYEKYSVQVEDVPYVITAYDGITLTTNMNEMTKICRESRWELRNGIPYIEIRSGLFAKLGRAVLYNMIEEFGEAIGADGASFPLGDSDG